MNFVVEKVIIIFYNYIKFEFDFWRRFYARTLKKTKRT